MLLLYSVSGAKGRNRGVRIEERRRSGGTVKAAGCESGSLQQQRVQRSLDGSRRWERAGVAVLVGTHCATEGRQCSGGVGAAAEQVAHEVTKRDSLRTAHGRHS